MRTFWAWLAVIGTVFKISTNGVVTSLYSFTGGNDGANPFAGLVQGSDGYFYGTCKGFLSGPNCSPGVAGTVFKVSTNGALTSLYAFSGNDGWIPQAGLVQGSDGCLYGTTAYGGTNGGWGTVFKIGTNRALTSLYSFGSVQDTNRVALDGANPAAGLVQGSDGNFYGTTQWGGTNGAGTVFKISTDGALTSLYSFAGHDDGGNPTAGLVQGSDGNFYGTTVGGGSAHYTRFGYWHRVQNQQHWGADQFVFLRHNRMPTATRWMEQIPMARWCRAATAISMARLSAAAAHELQRPPVNGTQGAGTVFQISTNGALTSLYSFTGGNDGANPYDALVQGRDGSFYGTTSSGGARNAGTVFRLTIVPQPQLTIIPSGPYVILTWPTNYSGFTLQSTTKLGSSAVWTTNSSPPVVIGGENVVINTMPWANSGFIRLIQ